ncbi:rhodanese-like domain-containing protein [Nonomuraea turcica]|uniref:rhodanese-like domain-containing protein n=1 Tax=Nonomuraea sp. G32 TaxID=3067274 RepID=UPI00273B6F8A|nr:rhodanese-like domain-containing protein [Nonomuraea sp. G32]MDP4509347.1 hypothetical protein [Nonomuraea sp. G32]
MRRGDVLPSDGGTRSSRPTTIAGPPGTEPTRSSLVPRPDDGGTIDTKQSRNRQALGRSRGELTTKLHLLVKAAGPVTELADRINELLENSEIVVYCRGEYCVLAYDAVRLLTDRGRRAIRLSGGMLEWRLSELPIEAGAPA